MSFLTKVERGSSEQNRDMTRARISRDELDFGKIHDWLKANNPFDKAEKLLVSLSTGIVGDSDWNCDEVERVGESIQQELDNKSLRDCKVRRKDMVKGLNSKTSKVVIDKNEVTINPLLLFIWLIYHQHLFMQKAWSTVCFCL